MHYNCQPLFFSFLIPSLLGIGQLASGARIPTRSNPLVREVSQNKVEVSGLDMREYVCPNAAVRRNTVNVPVPIDQLNTVLQKLQEMEEDVLILIGKYNNEGRLDSTDPSGVFVGEDGEQVVSISNSSPTFIDIGSTSLTLESTSPALASASLGVLVSGAASATTSHSPALASASLDVSDSVAASTTNMLTTIKKTEAVATVTANPEDTNVAALGTVMASAFASSGAPIIAAASSTSNSDPDLSASPTIFDQCTVSSTLINVAASSTAISDPNSAASPSGSLYSAASTTDGAIFAQTSSGSGVIPSYTSSGISQDSTMGYIFNAQSSKNIAVYFGQTPVTSGTSLALQCADPNIDIVILAFVIAASDGGQYPQINFGAACGGQTSEMVSKAPGLLSYPQLASDISSCQTKYGKKVLLSIGGAASQISFSTATSASTFATTLWNLFGPPGNVDAGLRPFGSVQIDGFDVDNEDNLSANWATFASTLRSHYSSYKPKTYYLSSAPQCPFPDASNPLPLLLLCDFVWVQFYNNPACEIGSSGFTASLRQWSGALLKSTLAVKSRMYLGTPAFSAAGSTAYEAIGNAEGMQGIAKSVEELGLSNFGGVMFWDGPEGMLNTYGGKDVLAWSKAGLNS